MLDIFKSYLTDDNYIIWFNKSIYIYNYKKIISIDSNNIYIEIKDSNYTIRGEDITISKLTKKELLVTGTFESVTKNG